MFKTDGPTLPPNDPIWLTTRQVCAKCGKEYCVCNLNPSLEEEIKKMNKKLDVILTILDRRKHDRKER